MSGDTDAEPSFRKGGHYAEHWNRLLPLNSRRARRDRRVMLLHVAQLRWQLDARLVLRRQHDELTQESLQPRLEVDIRVRHLRVATGAYL